MGFLWVSLLLPIVMGGAIPGQENCALGPPYWCSHVSHARECGATNHCLQTVWKYQVIKPQSVETCTYCELLVNALKDELADNVTDERIASVLANACAAIPDSDFRDMCKGIVTEYVPELLQMFRADVSTDMICATVGFCSGLNDKWTPHVAKPRHNNNNNVGNNTYCADCTKFFKDVQQMITSKETLDELEQLLNQTLCSQLHGFSGICNDFLKEYLPLALQALADQVEPDITCRVFGFCTSTDKRIDTIKINKFYREHTFKLKTVGVKGEECDACKELFNEINQFLRDKANQDKVKYVLETEVCGVFTAYKDECKQLVEEYLPPLFELLVNELDPSTVCEYVGFCPVPSLLQAAVVKEPSTLVGPGFQQESIECTICETVMRELDTLLQQNSTIVEVDDLLEKICKRLPTEDLNKQCTDFVTEYGELVIKLIAQKLLDPKTFCTDIRLCTNTAVAVKEDGKCQLCLLLVTEIQALLANISADDLLNDLKGVCSFLPGDLSATCLQYVNEYGSFVITLIKSSPKTLCSLVQACNATSVHIPYMTKPIPETPMVMPKGPSEGCKVCGTVVVMLRYFLKNNSSKQEIEAALEAVCKYLPSTLSVPCQDFVDAYGDRIIDLITSELNATEICIELDLCKATSVKKQSPALSVVLSPYDTLPLVDLPETKKETASKGNGVECEACRFIMNYLDKELQNNKTEANIKAALKELCTKLPQELTGECSTFVDEYAQAVINFLLLDLSPDEICEKLSLCPAGVKALPQPVHIKLLKDVKAVPMVTAGPGCVICEYVIQTLDDVLKGNRSEIAIKSALDKICSYMPDTISQECVSFVNTYSEQIINLLVQEIDPKLVCTAIRVCTAQTESVRTYNIKVHDSSKVTAGPLCVICEYVIKTLDTVLEGNRSEVAIRTALDKICSYMPDTINQECVTFVNTYSQLIINLLVQEINPQQVCTALKVCTAQTHKGTVKIQDTKVHDTTNLKAGPECVLCEYIMKELDSILEDNSTQAEIEAALEKVCSLLPDTITAECINFVHKYEGLIVKLLLQEFTPNQICTLLGLCSTETSWGTFVKILPEKSKDSVECELCKVLVTEAREFLKKNGTKAELENFFKKACDELPDTVTAQCHDFVDTYVPAILDLIDQDLNPEQICQQVNACATEASSKSKDASLHFKPSHRLVGLNKCTYGPAYWCANKDNARKCNAMEHCMRHVWN